MNSAIKGNGDDGPKTTAAAHCRKSGEVSEFPVLCARVVQALLRELAAVKIALNRAVGEVAGVNRWVEGGWK